MKANTTPSTLKRDKHKSKQIQLLNSKKYDKLNKNVKITNINRSLYARQKRTNRDIVNIQRMLNVLRKKKTLARAAIPRSHRHFRHTDEDLVMNPLLIKHKRSMKKSSRFFRSSPDNHFHGFINGKLEHIKKLYDILDQLKQPQDTGDNGDDDIVIEEDNDDDECDEDIVEEPVDIATEIMNLKEIIEIEEEHVKVIKQNYSFFESTSILGIMAAAKYDIDKKRKDQMILEQNSKLSPPPPPPPPSPSPSPPVQKIGIIANTLTPVKMVLQRNDTQKQISNVRLDAIRKKVGDKKRITDFFMPTEGKMKNKVEKFYRDIYHDVIISSHVRVDTPKFKDTDVYLTSVTNVKKTTNIPSKRRDFCPACGSTRVRIDSKTTEFACMSCGIIMEGHTKYQQSFAESQASSTRSTAPYERVSHVQKKHLHFYIFIFLYYYIYMFLY